MKPHPLVEGQYLLETTKHRSKSVKKRPTRQSSQDTGRCLAAGDVAAIIQFAMRITAPLRSKAPAILSTRLWLCESQAATNAGKILVVNKGHLAQSIRKFKRRHDLRGDDGKPLRLNIGRLRKTFSNSLWRLSGGDMRAVAAALGNTPRVVDDHYLEVTPEMHRNHAFVGRALVAKWLNVSGSTNQEGEVNTTPVGGCGDPYHGHLAPKNGKACMDFLSCFKCKSYVLVEDPNDLHRLFSFYFFVDGERDRLGIEQWSERYGWILRLIDEVTAMRFEVDTVTAARKRGREEPIKFWRRMPEAGVVPYVE